MKFHSAERAAVVCVIRSLGNFYFLSRFFPLPHSLAFTMYINADWIYNFPTQWKKFESCVVVVWHSHAAAYADAGIRDFCLAQ